MLNLIEKLKVIDTSNTSNIIELDNIMAGVDGASTFGFSVTPTALQVNDGQRQQYKLTHQLDVRTLEPVAADAVKLAVIEANNNPVDVNALTSDGFLQMTGRLTRHDQYDQVVADRFLITQDSLTGLSGAPYAGDNLFSLDDIITPSGFSGTIDGQTTSVSGQDVTLTRVSGSDATPIRRMYSSSTIFDLPWPGIRIRYQINVTAETGNPLMVLQVFDAASSNILQVTENITGTGVFFIEATLPAGTSFIRPLIASGGTPGNAITFNQPLLTRGKSTFVL